MLQRRAWSPALPALLIIRWQDDNGPPGKPNTNPGRLYASLGELHTCLLGRGKPERVEGLNPRGCPDRSPLCCFSHAPGVGSIGCDARFGAAMLGVSTMRPPATAYFDLVV